MTELSGQAVGDVSRVHLAGSARELEVSSRDRGDLGVDLDELDSPDASEVMERERDRSDTGAEIDAERGAPLAGEIGEQE